MQNERDIEFTPGFRPGEGGGHVGAGASSAENGLDTVADHARELGAEARDRAHDLAGSAREIADDVRHRAADELETRLSDQKGRATHSLGDLAQSLRSASGQMSDQDGLGRYLGQAADRVDTLASFLDNREIGELVDEVEDFARRQPAAFVGGAFALGVLGARFLKSSRRGLAEEGRFDTGYTGRGGHGRLDDPRVDAVSRPGVPGYATPRERGEGFGDPRSI